MSNTESHPNLADNHARRHLVGSSAGRSTGHSDGKSRGNRAGRFTERRPIPRQTDMGSRRLIVTILALALGGFGIGTTEFVAMGLLNLIAEDFQISEASAGNVISAYAIGVVIGAPLITILTSHLPRRRLALALMAAFTIGNALTVFATTFPILMASRFIAGLPHGAYFSVAALIAASMAPKGQRGRYIAYSGLGLSVATVLGVPAAQWLGATFGWNTAFILVAAIGFVTFALLWISLPHMTLMPRSNPRTELGALVNPQVLLTLAIGTVGFGGMFAVYTYISWSLTERAGFNEDLMWIPLMLYGVGMVAGTWFGGRLADRNLEFTILGTLIALVVVLSSFYFTSLNAVAGTITFATIGFLGSTLIPSLQMRLMDTARDAQGLANALNHSALNMANAMGAIVGGRVISAGFGYAAPAFAGAIMAALGIAVWGIAYALRKREITA